MSRDCQITYAAIGIKGIGKGCRLAAETHIALDAGEPLGRKLILRLENEGLSVWTAYSRHSENGMAWFSFHEGNVVVKIRTRKFFKRCGYWLRPCRPKCKGTTVSSMTAALGIASDADHEVAIGQRARYHCGTRHLGAEIDACL